MWKVLDFCSELTLKIKLPESANGVSVFLCPTIVDEPRQTWYLSETLKG